MITVIDEIIVINTGHKIIKIHAINFHQVLIGTTSQYQVVERVTIAHQKVWGIEWKFIMFHQFFSNKYTNVDDKTKTINITNRALKYSTLFFIIPLNIFFIIGILSTSSKILNILKILNNAKIVYDQIQYIITSTKKGKKDNKSSIFIILKGNWVLWEDCFHLYKYSIKNIIDIKKSIKNISIQYFWFTHGIESINTIMIDKNIRNTIQ